MRRGKTAPGDFLFAATAPWDFDVFSARGEFHELPTAAEQGNLRATIRLLPQVLGRLNPTLTHLNQAFPSVRAFSREILPGVNQTAATIRASSLLSSI